MQRIPNVSCFSLKCFILIWCRLLQNKNAKIKQLEDTIIEQDNTIAENQKLLAEKDAELLRLQKELAKLKQL